MATTYKTPGVYVEEISKLPPSVAQVETAIPAFIGYTENDSYNGLSLINKPKRIKSLNEFEKTTAALQKDAQYLADGSDYINASHTDPPYTRIETILLKAFKFMPEPAVPDLKGTKQDRIYELRSYEGATDKLYQSKVHMFNEGGEIKLFKLLDFNAVFYAEVISGNTMPNLMYLTTFADMPTHEDRWAAFRAHPEWKAMSALPEYQNTVSKSVKLLLHPTDYSDF